MRSWVKCLLAATLASSALACDLMSMRLVANHFITCINPHVKCSTGATKLRQAQCFKDAGCGDPVCLEYKLKEIIGDCLEMDSRGWPEVGPIIFSLGKDRRNKLLKHICPNIEAAEKAVRCVRRSGGLPSCRLPNSATLIACSLLRFDCLKTAKSELCRCAAQKERRIERGLQKCAVSAARADRMHAKAKDLVCKRQRYGRFEF